MSVDEFNLILVHPGQTELDEQNRLMGNLDLPLSENGESQVSQLVEELENIDIGLIVCGPGLSSQQTAQQLSRAGAIKIRLDENLANLDLGLWHGKSVDELKETQPRIFKQWREHPETITPPEGEDLESATRRVRKSLKWVTKKSRVMNIALVTAQPLAAIVQSEVLGTDLNEIWDLSTECGSFTVHSDSLSRAIQPA